jgi:branched-chain amino acid aminotransferase
VNRIEVGTFAAVLEESRREYHRNYLAMYSSLWDAVTTDPLLMLVPMDDHLVHRGDGVFEAMKCVAGAIYNLGAHMERLESSAASIHLRASADRAAMVARTVETVRAGGQPECVVRIFLSRGPGSFGVNPYDCPESQFYIVVTRAVPSFMTKHPEGARLRTSSIPAKPAHLAEIKDCNYLPNVMMQREAVDLGADFVVGYDAQGRMTEGPTENVGIVTSAGSLVFPGPHGILRGTTMVRLAELAREAVAAGVLRGVEYRDIRRDEAQAAAEILVVGTTRDVIAVREYDGRAVGEGRPGPAWKALYDLLQADIRDNPERRTSCFEASA